MREGGGELGRERGVGREGEGERGEGGKGVVVLISGRDRHVTCREDV